MNLTSLLPKAARYAFVGLLLASGLWAWSRGISGPYHFDDFTTPLGDPASQSLSAWRTYATRTLRPLTKLTYAIEAGSPITSSASSRRVVSLSFHVVSAALLFLLILRLSPNASPLWPTMLAATWFLHPVHADAVLLASGRTAELSTCFVLAALIALDGSRRWFAALLFALACWARETAIAALLPIAVLAAVRASGQWRVAVRAVAPSLAAATLVVFWMVLTPRYRELADYSMLGRPFWPSVFAQVSAVPMGMWLLFQPARLSIDYGLPLATMATDPWFLLGLIAYVSAGAGIVLLYKRSPAVAVGLALWLAALLPTQSLIPKLDALTNRPLGLALAGLLVAAAPLVTARRQIVGTAAVCAVVVFAALLTAATAHRAALFRSGLLLWQDAASKSIVNERPYIQYALLLIEAGRIREATEAASAAARISPLSSQVDTLTRMVRQREVHR